MTKAKKGPAKVSGAVLIMILAVMTVLIILLAGSIAVVYSTHERVTVKYQESQAYYTMRSTLDVCVNSIIQDSGNALSSQNVYYYDGAAGDPIKVLQGGVAADKLQRGRYEELILYKVPICTETSDPDDVEHYNQWYDARTSSGVITSASQVNITASDLNGAGADITGDSDFSNFRSQYAVPSWTSSMKKGVDDTITFTVDMASIANMAVDESGNILTKMLDTGASNKAVVKLQILERQYNLGGSPSDPIGKQFITGERTKDYFRIKATCEITIDGEPKSYSVYYSTKEPEPQTAGVSSLSKINPGSKIRMINEANSLEDSTYSFTNDSITSGNVSIFGDLVTSASGCYFTLEKNDVFLVKGSLTQGDQPASIQIAQTGATVYCKDIYAQKPLIKTYNNAMANIVCSGTYETNCQNSNQYANLFANVFKYTNSNPVSAPICNGKNYFNDIFISGNMSNYVDVDETAKTVTAKRSLRDILGNSTFSGTLNLENGGSFREFKFTGTGCYTFISNHDTSDLTDHVVTFDASKVVNADYDADATYDTSSFKKKITLPGNLAGTSSNTLELKTRRSIFNERFEETVGGVDTWDSDGNFNTANPDQTYLWAHLKARDPVPAATYASPAATPEHDNKGVLDIPGGSLTIPNNPSNPGAGSTTVSFDSIIKPSSGTLKFSGLYKGHTCFDTTDGDITAVFEDEVRGNFYVVGSNKLKIYLTSTNSTKTFKLGDSGTMFCLIDYNTLNASDGSINYISGEPYGPKTVIYVPDDSGNPTVKNLEVYKLDSASKLGYGVICAQFDAPKTNLSFNSSGGLNCSIQLAESGYTIPTSVPVAIMGSTFTNSLTFAEDRAIWSMNTPTPPGNKTVNLVERYR